MTEQPPPSANGTPPAPPPASPPAAEQPVGQPAEQGADGWSLHRVTRTASAEVWNLVAADGTRAATLTVVYGDTVEGLLALPEGTDGDAARGLLGRLTELLSLDAVAGPGGVIHWTVATGTSEDFWRRSPGHRPTGAEDDLTTAAARVEPVLRAMFGEPTPLPAGGWSVDVGSVRVFVTLGLVEGSVLVRVLSITNVEVTPDGDLGAFLLNMNFSMPVGRFSLDGERGAVRLDHVLTADQLDEQTLARTVATIAQTADRVDDEIKARFGGRTFREEGSPVADAGPLGPGMAGGYL
ncbi:MAG TPA: YbjN domain-containing protein [Mycobacteriales bacterium]|jgi:hypothetical protein|nr:YbjN domain-containing protein [Mycobacteriales bacterium]